MNGAMSWMTKYYLRVFRLNTNNDAAKGGGYWRIDRRSNNKDPGMSSLGHLEL